MKALSDFTEEEREWMDTVAVNYVIAQSDGYQLGYAQAISDFTNNIIDYWEGSDDRPQQSVLDALVDLGVELGKHKEVVEKNIESAKGKGYDARFKWASYEAGEASGQCFRLFTKDCKEGTKNDS